MTFEQGTRIAVTENLPHTWGRLSDVLYLQKQTISGLLLGLSHVRTVPCNEGTSTGSGPFMHTDIPFSALEAEPCCTKIQFIRCSLKHPIWNEKELVVMNQPFLLALQLHMA